tara:strand:- start:339 stop:479 length:141 start_codon:yes stop_codon:yes gene_type:complete
VKDREKMIEDLIKAGGGSLPFMLTDEEAKYITGFGWEKETDRVLKE